MSREKKMDYVNNFVIVPQSLQILALFKKQHSKQFNVNRTLEKDVSLEFIRNEALEYVDKLLPYVRENHNCEVGVKETIKKIFNNLVSNKIVLQCLKDIREKDLYTYGHCINVGVISTAMGIHLDLKKEDLWALSLGAMLHDIGKCKVPDNILQKPGPLTEEEWKEMKRHPRYGCDILESYGIVNPKISKIVLQHHEKLNGTGYPNGLEGDKIDKLARICTVADIYDAMTTDRVYKKASRPHEAAMYLFDEAFVTLDPEVINVFSKSFDIYKGEAGKIAADYTDKVLKEFYFCLSQKYSCKILNDKSFDYLVMSRLRKLNSIFKVNECNLMRFFKNFYNEKTKLHDEIFKKIYYTIQQPELELEQEHLLKNVFEFGDVVSINGCNDELQSKWIYTRTLVSNCGKMMGEVLPNSLCNSGKLMYDKSQAKYIRIAKLRRYNPEY